MSLRFAVGVVLLVVVGFGVFYGGASALSAYVPWRIGFDLPLDHAVPFVPWTSVVYLSMDLLVVLAPLVLRDRRDLAAFAGVMLVELVVAAVCFVLLPGRDAFPPRVVEGGAAPTFWLADTLNLERNYFPSLHVAFSFTAARAYQRGRGVHWWLWAVAIAASTMLMHEHYLLDVVGGVVLALVVYARCFDRLVEFDLAEALTTEWLVLTDFVRFAARHRRYAVIDLALYALALAPSRLGFRERRVLRTGFAFLQVVDDVLDGDRAVVGETPLGFARRAVELLESQRFSEDHLGRLARAFVRDAPAEAVPVATRLIRTMMRDRERIEAKARWPEVEVRAQLHATFEDSLEVLLVCGGSSVRATQVPRLVELMSWCSAVRDLEDDLAMGLCNVPAEVPLESRAAWVAAEAVRARALFPLVEAELAALGDARAARWLGVLARSTRKYLPLPATAGRGSG